LRRTATGRAGILAVRLDFPVDLMRGLGDQEQAAADQDDVAPGDTDAEYRK